MNKEDHNGNTYFILGVLGGILGTLFIGIIFTLLNYDLQKPESLTFILTIVSMLGIALAIMESIKSNKVANKTLIETKKSNDLGNKTLLITMTSEAKKELDYLLDNYNSFSDTIKEILELIDEYYKTDYQEEKNKKLEENRKKQIQIKIMIYINIFSDKMDKFIYMKEFCDDTKRSLFKFYDLSNYETIKDLNYHTTKILNFKTFFVGHFERTYNPKTDNY